MHTDARAGTATGLRSPAPSSAESHGGRLNKAADAARQALLRRLAAPLKHDMVVHLQSVSMLTETLSARLDRRGWSDPAELQASIARLNRLAREAVAGCLKVASWFDSGQEDTAALHQVAQECQTLLGGNLNFRGFTLSTQVAETDFDVARGATRNLLAAAILVLTDTVGAPGEILVHADVSPDEATLTVVYFAAEPGSTTVLAPDTAPPPLDWSDVQALAAAEGIGVFRTGNEILLRLPRAQVTSPLQMAPV